MAIEENMSRDDHEHDLVMPGFRFHPTEEELIEFYLRRKVEGKRFNVELITFLDLYRYDPWELPALAAIGEKEWFFYVPRDRKYRNGDRPNRVTTSGYWKATGADRMIRGEDSRQIGLKKTLVFYSGKAPKGIRSSWIMNEYRLPQADTDRYQKAEISLCRVYKRAGGDDHYNLPSTLSSKTASSRQSRPNTVNQPKPACAAFPGDSSSSNSQSSAEKLQKGVSSGSDQHALLHVPTTASLVEGEDATTAGVADGFTSLLPFPSQPQQHPFSMLEYWNYLQQPDAGRDFTSNFK
ncbi:uncharacterized protein A4U43_C04F26520 [Asparagus officinalis]|uniref:NAC domain-containing protein n=1 Tax=Asparagus officinalis TaxID=4686 RepID=A0A5P1F8R0_ASPOF|nr:NAC domain-containing protein 35-like [Asparagus officinalis]ONK73041.1 uncharacterized protein A4U43_C04F26520 [Asparagus officinalis]